MNQNIKRLACLFALATGSLLAQNTAGTGGIAGTVQDASGSVVPGAKVVVSNTDRGIHREMETNSAGVFTAPSLTPASGYQVEVSKPGFAGYQLNQVIVNVGEMVTITARLTVSSANTKVEVSADAPVIENEKTDVSQVVDSRQILDLPINGRRVDSFVLLTPGVTADQAFGLLTFRGNPGGNTFLTDGIDTTNSFYDENAGRTRTYNISQDAVQEFQVISSNFLPEYGRASGGVVNTVTRSGTNGIHGTAYWFFRNHTLNATDPFAQGINGADTRHQAGASVGGPIKKDKIFYFFNGELQRRNFPIISSNINSTYFTPQGVYIPATAAGVSNCTTPATPTQCAAAIAYLSTRVAPQLVPRHSDVNLMFGKVDYQISDRNRFTAEMNYLDFRSPNGIQTQTALTNGAGVGNDADTNVFDRTIKASLTTVVSASAVNELRFGMFKDRQYDPASPTLLPSVGPIGLSVGNLSNVGYATSYPRLLPSETRFQLADTFSLVRGRHSMKFGIDFSHTEDYVNNLSNQFGTYSYTSLTAFAQDFSGNTTGAKNWTTYSQRFGNAIFDGNVKEFSVFAQDEIHITPKLTLSPGARYEYTALPQPKTANPDFPLTGKIPGDPLNLAPRMGLSYAFDDKTVFRAGYGMFFNRYITSTIESLFEANGTYQPSYSLRSTTPAQLASGPVFPNPLASVPNVTGSASVAFADPGFRNAYSQQLQAGVERQIAKDTSLTVSYIWSRGLHIISTADANAADPTQFITYSILDASGAKTGKTYTTPFYTQRINPNYGTVLRISSGENTYYNGLIVQLQKRYSGFFQAQAAYTYSHAIDDNIGGASGSAGSTGILYTPSFPTSSIYNGDFRDEKGSSSNDQRHRLVVNGIFNPTFVKGSSFIDRNVINGWQLSIISTFASSYPLTPTISTTGGVPTGALSTSTINGLGGSGRVPFESTSFINVAPIYRTDARLSHSFTITERLKMTLMFEASNVFNHFILAGGTPRTTQQFFTTKMADGTYGLQPYPLFMAPLTTQGPPDGTTARRAQAAVRFTF